MDVSSSAAAKPPLKPFPSQFGDVSDKLLDLWEKTLIEVEALIEVDSPFSEPPAADSPFSEMKSADSPFSEMKGADSPFSEQPAADSPFSEMKGADSPFSETPVADSSFSGFDDTIVPETAFDDPIEGFVPDSEDYEAAAVTAEAAAVTAEEEAPLCADLEEMIGLLVPAYLKLVRSFP